MISNQLLVSKKLILLILPLIRIDYAQYFSMLLSLARSHDLFAVQYVAKSLKWLLQTFKNVNKFRTHLLCNLRNLPLERTRQLYRFITHRVIASYTADRVTQLARVHCYCPYFKIKTYYHDFFFVPLCTSSIP